MKKFSDPGSATLHLPVHIVNLCEKLEASLHIWGRFKGDDWILILFIVQIFLDCTKLGVPVSIYVPVNPNLQWQATSFDWIT
jgi:hypothetical protein